MEEHEFLADVWKRIDPSVPKPRLFYSVAVCLMAAVGGYAFGYDVGVLASILVMPRFTEQLSLTTVDKANIVGTFLIGCTVGSIFQSYFADTFGRKWSIIIGGVVSTAGGFIQAFASSVVMLFIGRLTAGLAIGMFSALVPIYMAECVIYTFRGQMVTFQQLMIVLGVSSAYWIDFLTYKVYTFTEWQWRGPLLVQAFLGIVLLIGVVFLPKSPRWLLKKGLEKESLESLAKLRMLPTDNEYVRTEFEEMKWSHEQELAIGTSSYLEVFQNKSLRKRLVVMLAINAYQQLTGIQGVNYYAPTFYQQLQVGGPDAILLLQGFYGILKLIMTIPTFFIVDKFGRRPLLFFGSVIMSVSMLGLGFLFLATTGGDPKNVASLSANKSYGYLGVALIWLFVVGFNSSWGPITWVVSAEVFPLRVRSRAIALTAGLQWACNTATAYAIPLAIAQNTFAIFLVLGSLGVSSIFVVYFFLPETKNVTLEEMDMVWEDKKTRAKEVAHVDVESPEEKKAKEVN
ncbi:Plasma membrane low glucose sensor [Nowakowskiella sp. JEL0407]|nr:Plasma membrane low glucose sensor [Nowakowskiella sp. JEL0407]